MTQKELLHFIDHNKRKIISLAVLLIAFIFVCQGAKVGARKADPLYGARESYTQSTQNQDINGLITSYYEAYYSNNISVLETLAYPISEKEKSYIAYISGYVESCEVVEILTKPGVKTGSYLASVDANIKFKDVDSSSPGLDFFYIQTDNQGNLYIDNLYSSSIGSDELVDERSEEILALIDEFENQEDLVMLRLQIQNEYNALLETDEGYRAFVSETLPTALSQWLSDYNTALAKAEAEAEAAAIAEAEAAAAAEAEAKAAEEAAKAAEAAAAAEAEAAAAAEAAAQAEAAAAAEAAAQEAAAAAQIPEGGYAKGTEITASDILNIREEPDVNSTKIGTVMKGSKVVVLENSGQNGWTKIDHKGKIGYIRTDVLK